MIDAETNARRYEEAKVHPSSTDIMPQRHHTETDAVNAIVDAQRAAGDAIDPAGAKRLIRYLVALGLLHFE